MAKKHHLMEMKFKTDASEPALLSAILIRGTDELRNRNWWTNGYQNWDESSFKKVKGFRDTFEYILSV